MKKNNFGFSLIEIIVASSILTIGVFGVYKLIGNNMNLISNNENYTTLASLYNPFKECLKYIGYNSLSGSYDIGDSFSINFGNDNMGCFTGTYNENFNFSGVLLNNQKYYMYSKISSKEEKRIILDINIYNPLSSYLFEDNLKLIISR